MHDLFLFAALPYLALFSLVAGCLWRLRSRAFSYSALSSQFLEDKQLKWGSVPWHAGLFVLLAGHLVALCLPNLWQWLVSSRTVLLVIESIGAACAFHAQADLRAALIDYTRSLDVTRDYMTLKAAP